VEHEALEILEACDRELARELPAARLLQAALEDGESDSIVVNSRGVEARWRQRTATLYLEAALGSHQVFEYVGETGARDFHPAALSRRIVDRLLIRRDGSPASRASGPVLLAPPVGARILGALLPLLMGTIDRRSGSGAGLRNVGSKHLTIVDDGRLPGGLFAAPVDGEGVPTGRKVLLDHGIVRSHLSPGVARDGASPTTVGCVRRASYRDLPRVGPSHLFIESDRTKPPGALLEEVARGHYFLEVLDAGRFDFARDRFEMTVAGFAVRSGRPTAAVSEATLSGRISQLLGGLEAVARDLTFFPLGGLLGSPSLRVAGLTVDA
jgi:PmbA protein